MLSPTHPGATILDILEGRGWSRQHLAVRSGLDISTIDSIMSAKTEIDADIAEALSHGLGSTAGFWMARELNFRTALDTMTPGQRKLWFAQLAKDTEIPHAHGRECHHGSGTFLSREMSHIRSHWFSCALFCVVTHIGWHLGEWAVETAQISLLQ